MAFTLHSITYTTAIGDESGQTRFVYRDKATGQTMTLLEPLYATDDVDSPRRNPPTRRHTMVNGRFRIVTTWRASSKKGSSDSSGASTGTSGGS